jgi:CheY-like chemotaxis protein
LLGCFIVTGLATYEDHRGNPQTGVTLNNIIILLADDDEDDRELFAEAIERFHPGVKLHSHHNGLSLLQHLQEGIIPDIIILDLNMPGMSGKDCLVEIRNNALWNRIPVVIYSTSSNKKDIEETYNCGANLYLVKPDSFLLLVQSVRKVFDIDLDMKKRSPKDFLLNYSM